MSIIREQRWLQGIGEWLLKLGGVAVITKAYGEAQDYLQEAIAPLRGAGRLNWLGFLFAPLGVAQRGQGDGAQAVKHALEVL